MTVQKTKRELEDVFRVAVLRMLKLPEDDPDSVRFPYGNTPDFPATETVCYVYILPAEDGYGTLSEIAYRFDNKDFTHIDTHTNVLTVNFVCYGPDAERWAGEIKDGINRPDIRRYLWENSLAHVMGSFTLSYVPEPVNGVWRQRCDASGRFYQYVRLERAHMVGVIEEIPLQFKQERKGE